MLRTARLLGQLMFHDTRLQIKPVPNGYSMYRDGLYCGPGWGFTIDDVRSDRMKPAAFDVIDDACRRHDQCFADCGYFTIGCDLVMGRELSAIVFGEGSTPQQRVDASVMAAYFFVQANTLDVVVSAGREMRDRIDAAFRQGMTMLEAIERELRRHVLRSMPTRR